LQDKGTPEMVQRVLVAPPQSRIGPLSEAERAALIASSPLQGRYDKPIDRESAYEVLMGRKAWRLKLNPASRRRRRVSPNRPANSRHGGGAGAEVGDAPGGEQLGKQLVRGLMGSLLGGSKRR
jgi:DNA helicase HerA-like ATPase